MPTPGCLKGINATNWPDNRSFNINNLAVEDHYVVDNNDTKWHQITTALNSAAAETNAAVLHLTHASGYIGMKIRVIVAGKPALPFAKAGIGEYLKRLTRFGDYEWESVKAGSAAEVSTRLLQRSAGCFRVALDERGEMPDTRRLADQLAAWERCGTVKTVVFLVGAADGHTEDLRRQCDWLLALSRLTLQHELAALLLLEQLYRAATLRAGMPYHRD